MAPPGKNNEMASVLELLRQVVGTVYHATPVARADGELGPLEVDEFGNLKVGISADVRVDIDSSNLATHADAVAINTKQTDGGQKTQVVGSTAAALLPDAAAPADSMTAVAMSKIVSYLAAFNGSSFMLIRAGLTTISATVAGYLNTIPTAKYDTAPGARTNGQSGPLQADANGSLITIDANTPTATALADADVNPTTTKVGAALMGWSGSWARIKAGITTPTGTFTGWLNTLPWAKYDTAPTVRTNGQGGPLQADANGNLLVYDSSNQIGSGTDGSAGINLNNVFARLVAFNASSQFDKVRAGITTISSTFTGYVNTLPWAKYDLTPTTRTTGQGGPLQAESDGSVRVSLSSRLAGERLLDDVLAVRDDYLHTQIAGITAGTAVKAAPGFLHAIQIGEPKTATVQIYDNASGSTGTLLFDGVIVAGNPFSIILNKKAVNGIYVVVGTAGVRLGVSYA